MDLQQVFQAMIERAGARTVYADPLSAEGRTIVPVAKISYGFGGGNGTGNKGEASGRLGGGGGGFRAKPVGFIEITGAGTRFVRIGQKNVIAGAIVAGFALGWLLSHSRITIARSKRAVRWF